MIENVRVEEGIGENTEPGSHARLAQDYAHEAVELAKHTENRRLLAYAHIWQGLTCSNRFFNDSESARLCYDQAVTLSKGVHALACKIDELFRLVRLPGFGRIYPHMSLLAGSLQKFLLHLNEAVYAASQQIDQRLPTRAVTYSFFHACHQKSVLLLAQVQKYLLSFQKVGHALAGEFAENRRRRVLRI